MTSRWYAIAVAVRREAAAARDLTLLVDDVFLPLHRERRAWSDRVKVVEEPLFPGYLFARFELTAERRVKLLKVAAVADIVGRSAGHIDRIPAVPDLEIEALRSLLLVTERELDPVVSLVPGTPVVVAAGPLRGVRGVVEVGADGHRRLLVQIALLGRGVRTLLSIDDVIEDIPR